MIDYLNPNYTDIFAQRAERLSRIRKDPKLLTAAKLHYKRNPWDFVSDWGMTFEPRNIEKGLPALIPFVLFPKQVEFMRWIYDRWQAMERGLAEKSRDFGASWLVVGFSVAMFLFHDGFTAGIGSRKEALVDKKGDPKSVFEKIRMFLRYLPKEFRPEEWNERENCSFLKISNPENGSTITGEAGDDIGRGARMSIYFVDEAAFIQRQDTVDAALSQTTNCQIDISTPNGNGNLFYKKRHSGKLPVFVMDWRDDPRKTQEWYEKQLIEQDSVTVAQEIDRDYNASTEDIFIPAKWVAACIDAHLKLGIEPSGADVVSFDPADTGDARALGHRKGIVFLEAIQRKDGDITDAMPWAFEFAHSVKADVFRYDADGMGAPSMKLYLNSVAQELKMSIIPFYGGRGNIFQPKQKYKENKSNEDTFVNRRGQAWMNVRDRAQATYEAVVLKKYRDPSDLMSISSKCTELTQLQSELSRPKRIYNGEGKIGVESKEQMRARGVESPNLADQLIYNYDFESVPIVKQARQPINYPRVRVV